MAKSKNDTRAYDAHIFITKKAEELQPRDEIVLEDGGCLLVLAAASNGIYANVAYRGIDGKTQTYAFQPNEEIPVRIPGKGRL